MTVRRLILLLAACLAVGACAADREPARADATERIVRIVSDAISYPRQDSAAGFARAALDTRAARSDELTVVEATDRVPTVRDADDRLLPIAHLVFRVHLEAGSDGWRDWPDVTTCYAVDFSQYGVVGEPRRVTCPVGAPALTPPLAPSQRAIPPGADRVVDAALAHASPSEKSVRTAVLAALPAPAPGTLPPLVQVDAHGEDVGVSVRGAVGECLLGSRVRGEVLVWRPSVVQVQPGEITCDPAAALHRAAVRPPH